MKPALVPTAPSRLQERAQQPRPVPPRGVGWLVLSVLLSFSAGVVGSVFMLTVLTDWPGVRLWLDGRDHNAVIISDVKSTATAEVVQLLQQRATQALVLMYDHDTMLGLGIIVSNDGWIMTLPSVIGDRTSVTIVDQVDTAKPASVRLSDRIVQDHYTGFSFVHIAQTDLPIVDFRSEPVLLGDGVMVISQATAGAARVSVAYLQTIDQALTSTRTTAANNITYQLDRVLTNTAIAAPVFDYEGKLIGLYSGEQTIVPVRTVEQRLPTLLESADFTYAASILTYTLTSDGAMVATSTLPELAAGDTIIEVDGQIVDRDNDLSWLLADAEQTTVELVVVHNHKRQGRRVTLD